MIDAFVVDRRDEADRITGVILGAKAGFVVLYGEADSGKSEFLSRWVIPALRASGRVVFTGACAPNFPSELVGPTGVEPTETVLRRSDIIVVDDFEALLALPKREQRNELDRLFDQLNIVSADTIVVLVTDSRQLSGVYALASYDQDATADVHELQATPIDETLRRLEHPASGPDVRYTDAFLGALRKDCDEAMSAPGTAVRTEWLATIDLAHLVHERFTALHPGQRVEVDLLEYVQQERIGGILRARLDSELAKLSAARAQDGEIGLAILENMLAAVRRGLAIDVACLGPQIGANQADIERVIDAGLAQRLFRRKPNGELRAVPQQLLYVVEEKLATRAPRIEQARRIADDGARDWARHGTLLTQQRFLEVHAERQYLLVDVDKARFLLHCALLHDRAAPDGAAAYWLARIDSHADARGALLESLDHELPAVRARAASLLAAFPSDEVAQRLGAIALLDSDAAVRRAAVDSLEAMKTESLYRTLIAEAGSGGRPSCVHAIDALRLFPRPETVRFAAGLVANPATELAVRESAIGVLARIGSADSVDMLVDITIEDPDPEDRALAASALTSVSDDTMLGRIFARLEPMFERHVGIMQVAILASLTIILAIWCTFFVIVAASATSETSALPWVILVGLVGSLLSGAIVRLLMKPLVAAETGVSVVRATLGVLWFAVNAFILAPLVHGLAHASAGARKRGALLLGLEALAVVFLFQVAPVLYSVPRLRWAGNVYTVLGVLLFLGTYCFDVIGAVRNQLLFPAARKRESRAREVYEQLFTNPRAAGIAFDSLDGTPSSIASAGRLLRRFGRHVGVDQLITMLGARSAAARRVAARALTRSKSDATVAKLEQAWAGPEPRVRSSIVPILAAKPTARSLEALEKIRAEMTPAQRVRAAITRVTFQVAIWPVSVRIAVLALLPTLLVLVYNGIEMIHNPAWSQITMLNQTEVFSLVHALNFNHSSNPQAAESARQRVKIIQFLADAYPDQSRGDLVRLLGAEPPQSIAVRAALTTAIAEHPPGPDVRESDQEKIRSALSTAVDTLRPRLFDADSGTFESALHALASVARWPDSSIARRSAGALTAFVESPKIGTDSTDHDRLAVRAGQVVAAIGAMDYQRALPWLDTLRSVAAKKDKLTGSHGFASDAIIDQISTISQRAMEHLPPDSLDQRKVLLATFNKLMVKPEPTIRLARAVARDSAAATRCANKESEGCRHWVKALAWIDENPSYEFGYRDLLEHYSGDSSYVDAVTEFRELETRMPTQLWPRLLLAEVLHENIAPRDPKAFASSFQEMQGLRALKAYDELRTTNHDRFTSIEAEYAEIALSARQVGETDRIARALAVPGVDTTYGLNATIFAYIAHVVTGDRIGALDWLERVSSMSRSLTPNFSNGWTYPGTTAFINGTALSADTKEALLALLLPGTQYTPAAAQQAIARNRAMLGVRDRP